MEELKPPPKAKLVEVNSHLTCHLCKGYYIDATTIVECLHSFCRSCIILFLQQNSFCPICEVMINTAKPNIKPDKTLQDIVYKLVPGLYASEMMRRRRFWTDHPEEAQKVPCPEARGHTTERIIFSPQDAISLSIEYTCDDQPDWNRNKALGGNGADQEIQLRRYLQCPAMLRVEHMKKFICNKYNVDNTQYHVEILHKRVPLPDHYTLMDIAYIYSWKRNEPMKFFFRITEMHLVSERFDYLEPSLAGRASSPPPHTPVRYQKSKQHTATKVEQSTPTNARRTHDNNTCDKFKTSDMKTRRDEHNKTTVKRVSDKVLQKDRLVTLSKSSASSNDNQKKHSELKAKSSENYKDKSDDHKVVSASTKTSKQTSCDSSVGNVSKTLTNPVRKESLAAKLKLEAQLQNISTPVKLVTSTTSANTSASKNAHPNKNNTDYTKKCNKHSPKEFKYTHDKEILKKTGEKHPIDYTPKKSDTTPKLAKRPLLKFDEVSISCEDPDLEAQKCHFFKSIQLTAKSSLPSSQKSSPPEITITKTIVPRQKQARKHEKSPNSIKSEPPNKIQKLHSSSSSENTRSESKDIKNPLIRNIVTNVNRQVSSLTKLVGQTDSSKNTDMAIQMSQNERLKSLIDSCKLNIPSSLSITLTESPRNEDGSFAESKPAAIKPVQNYIEILKLPDANSTCADGEIVPKTELDGKNGDKTNAANKLTFQTMFEETVRSQVQALKARIAHKGDYSAIMKKQHSFVLDLSRKLSDAPDSTMPSVSATQSSPSNSPTPKEPDTSPSTASKKIIINNNFNSGGSMSILDTVKKTVHPPKVPVPKLPIPRLPVHRQQRAKTNQTNVKNGAYVKGIIVGANTNTSPDKVTASADTTQSSPSQILEKYRHMSQMPQFNHINVQLAFHQALIVEQCRQQWLQQPHILAQYENYVQTLKNQQNQKCANNNQN